MSADGGGKISRIGVARAQQGFPAFLRNDYEAAISQLIAEGSFQPANDAAGPYEIDLAVEDNRLIFRIRNASGADLPMLILSLKPYKRLIQDYFIILDSYARTAGEGNQARLQAIDMGRRGLHDEAASLLMERLRERISMDHNTARRLFTLICTLQPGAGRTGHTGE